MLNGSELYPLISGLEDNKFPIPRVRDPARHQEVERDTPGGHHRGHKDDALALGKKTIVAGKRRQEMTTAEHEDKRVPDRENELTLSKETLEDLSLDEEARDVLGGGKSACTEVASGCY